LFLALLLKELACACLLLANDKGSYAVLQALRGAAPLF
jgi:hypothetical protein